MLRWSRECVVLRAEPGEEFTFRTLRRGRYADSTVWRFTMAARDGGTHLVQTMALSAGPAVLAFERLSGRDRSMPQGMRATLERIAEDVAGRAGAPM